MNKQSQVQDLKLSVGPLRFAKPVAAAAWDGVRNVTEKGVACPAVAESV